jgi:hypothetical protein
MASDSNGPTGVRTRTTTRPENSVGAMNIDENWVGYCRRLLIVFGFAMTVVSEPMPGAKPRHQSAFEYF